MKTLQNILLVNAVSSGATGLLLVLFASFVAQLFEVQTPEIFIGVGIFLLVFAGLVFYESRRTPMHFERIRFIILLDRLWVVASLALVVWPTVDMSVLGRIMVIGVALWVALMAYLQASSLRKITA